MNRVGNVISSLMSSGVLMYHMFQESKLTPPIVVPPNGPNPPVVISQDEIEKKINNPVPKQCYRHVYKDEKGQMRTIVVCTTHGHP